MHLEKFIEVLPLCVAAAARCFLERPRCELGAFLMPHMGTDVAILSVHAAKLCPASGVQFYELCQGLGKTENGKINCQHPSKRMFFSWFREPHFLVVKIK